LTPQAIEPPTVATLPISPLNTNVREETLTLAPPVGEAETTPRLAYSPQELSDLEAKASRPGPFQAISRATLAAWRRELERPSPVVAPVPASSAPAPVPAPEPKHVETIDLLRRLATPIGSEAVEPAARRLAERLEGSMRSLAYFRKTCRRVAVGELSIKTLIGAWKQASGDGANRPGAVFAAFLREYGPPGAQKEPASGHTRQSSPDAGLDRAQGGMPNGTRRLTP
jgi:hypothetical protein